MVMMIKSRKTMLVIAMMIFCGGACDEQSGDDTGFQDDDDDDDDEGDDAGDDDGDDDRCPDYDQEDASGMTLDFKHDVSTGHSGTMPRVWRSG